MIPARSTSFRLPLIGDLRGAAEVGNAEPPKGVRKQNRFQTHLFHCGSRHIYSTYLAPASP